jgi:hypothetical protein
MKENDRYVDTRQKKIILKGENKVLREKEMTMLERKKFTDGRIKLFIRR